MNIRIKNKLFSLKTELLATIAIVCMLVLLATSYGSYNAIFHILSSRTEEQTVQQLRQIEYNIANLVEDIGDAHAQLLASTEVQAFLEKDEQDTPESIYINIDLVAAVSEMLNYYTFIDSIDLFTERGEAYYISRQRNSRLDLNEKENLILDSEIYKEAVSHFPSTVWKAGLKRETTPFYNDKISNPDMHVISAVKCTRSVYNSKNNVIAINVNEKYLSDLYNKFTDENNALNVYTLVENEDWIPVNMEISTAKRNRLLEELNSNSVRSFGQITYSDSADEPETNLFYYRIQNLNWTLVREIPLNEVSDDVKLLRSIMIVTFALSFLVILLMTYFWINRRLKPIYKLSRAMLDAGKGNFGKTLKRIPRNEIGLLIKQFNTMSVNILHLLEENRQMEDEKRVQEVKALQAQINPHFLYNTLNAIKYMAIVSGAQNVAESITILGNIIRPIFKERSIMYQLREEIEFVRNYIEILNIRFGNNISLKYEISEQCLDCKVPRFLLQPIIENSIIHGIETSDSEEIISISVISESDSLILAITDSGIGMDEGKVRELNDSLRNPVTETNEGAGIGIRNVNRRIQLHYGKQYGLTIESRLHEGTQVFVKIPPTYEEKG
ncbi:cache domain-containing sensor histidine kinase [Paenibacillus cymbidii]|uniref:cache domain-containing sensor histidine kinase n=1 Tax=Paenibacillus cymbidii TaxID=1639034 RepID=UPI0010805BFC|nr:sensor histidine kinase [Paenibacillus cymbidii]